MIIKGSQLASVTKQHAPIVLKNGQKTWVVRWREGGSRTDVPDRETCDSWPAAKRFRTLVEAAGERRPAGYPKGCRGIKPALAEAEVNPASTSPVFWEYATQNIRDRVNASEATKNDYLEDLNKHVTPFFKEMRLEQIKRKHIRDWQAWMLRKGSSAQIIAKVRRSVIKPVFRAACRDEDEHEEPLCLYDPTEGVEMPSPTSYTVRDILEPEEAALFFKIAYETHLTAADFAVVEVSTGLRYGEIAGISRKQVDLEAATVAVTQVLAKNRGRWFIRRSTKSKAGYRIAPLHQAAVKVLRRLCEGLDDDDLVFTAPEGGCLIYSNFRREGWNKILAKLKAAGFKKHITPHGLRHTMNTALVDAHVDMATRLKVVGHADLGTNTIYNRLSKAQQLAVTNAVDPIMKHVPETA